MDEYYGYGNVCLLKRRSLLAETTRHLFNAESKKKTNTRFHLKLTLSVYKHEAWNKERFQRPLQENCLKQRKVSKAYCKKIVWTKERFQRPIARKLFETKTGFKGLLQENCLKQRKVSKAYCKKIVCIVCCPKKLSWATFKSELQLLKGLLRRKKKVLTMTRGCLILAYLIQLHSGIQVTLCRRLKVSHSIP